MAEDLIETHSVFSHALVSFSIGEWHFVSTFKVLNYIFRHCVNGLVFPVSGGRGVGAALECKP